MNITGVSEAYTGIYENYTCYCALVPGYYTYSLSTVLVRYRLRVKFTLVYHMQSTTGVERGWAHPNNNACNARSTCT